MVIYFFLKKAGISKLSVSSSVEKVISSVSNSQEIHGFVMNGHCFLRKMCYNTCILVYYTRGTKPLTDRSGLLSVTNVIRAPSPAILKWPQTLPNASPLTAVTAPPPVPPAGAIVR